MMGELPVATADVIFTSATCYADSNGCNRPKADIETMKTYFAISFVSALSLEDLAERVGLHPVEFDAENEDEWALGSVAGFSDIDIARTHLLPPNETRTSVFRYNHSDRAIPTSLINEIYSVLVDCATEFQVHGSENGLAFNVEWSDFANH
jgi:hypothetical protein